MITLGNQQTQTLISVRTDESGTPEITSLAPRGTYLRDDPAAPWNAWWSADPAEWREKYPAAYAQTADDDPAAPWNNEPSRDPADYLTPDGDPALWEPPVLIPLVKLPPPPHDAKTQTVEPVLVWHDDRVERDWTIRDLTPEEIAARSRKVWEKGAEFLAEFPFEKLAAISLSTDPTIAALRLLLASWAGEVWSDDPRVIAGLDALEAAGIVSAEERATKFAKG